MVLLTGTAAAQNYEYSATFQPNLAQIQVTAGLHAEIGNYIANSSAAMDVAIAILDGRADSGHVDLNGRTTVITVYPGFYSNDTHGTHVTGIAGASQNGIGIVGVNPFARLLSIPVFGVFGWVATDLGEAALDAAVSNGAIAANMSYGPVATGDVFLDGELTLFDNYKPSLVLVRAAGNDGVIARNEYYPLVAHKRLSHLLIVGSVDANNKLSSFSNRPGRACISTGTRCGRKNRNAMMRFFIVAPGEQILSDLPGNQFGYLSGTSMAAPHVAGAAALVYQYALAGNTKLTPSEVVSILKHSATDLGRKGVDGTYGWGLLNVAAALSPVGGTFVASGDSVEGGLQPMSGATLSQSSIFGQSAGPQSLLSGMVVFDAYKRAFVLDNVRSTSRSSHLLETSIRNLVAGLVDRTNVLGNSGSASLTFSEAGDVVFGAGYGVLSLTGERFGLQAGFGNPATYFAATASQRALETGSFGLGADFFVGSGDVGAGLARAMFIGGDVGLSQRLSVSGLIIQSAAVPEVQELDWQAQQRPGKPDTASLVRFGLNYRLTDSISLGASYGLLHEQGRLLGAQAAGALSLGEAGVTQLVGASLRAQITDKAAMAILAEASRTSSWGDRQSVFSGADDWWGSKFGVSLEYQSLLSASDVTRLVVARPWRLDSGTLSARVPVGRELDGTVNFEDRTVSLADGGFPLEMSLAYQNRIWALSYGGAVTMSGDDIARGKVAELAVTGGLHWRF